MKIPKVFAFIFITALFLPCSPVRADWVWSPEQGKFINTESETQSDAEDIFDSALDLYKEKKLDKAAEQFKLLLKKFPKSRVAPEAEYRLGTIYEEKSDYIQAHKTYQALIKSYPQSERFEEVIEREYQIGMMFLSGKKGKVLGLEIRPSLPLAIEVFKKLVEAAPYGAFGDKAQFNLGVAYQKSGSYDESVEAFQGLIDQYPQSTLIQQARLQMAEVAYEKSSKQTRDQAALDEAARQAQGYLKRYPGSEEAEKAAKINQQIDELNAEKNYRIGLYYEKDNYLESALIYYRDTAKRYASTSWGQKAADKLQSLQEPVKYLNAKAEELQKELGLMEAKYQSLGRDQKAEREQLKKEIEQMKKRIKSLDKNKAESLERRKQDLKRRQQELKEKFKELERKKKRFKNNTSPDFQKAIDRWQASLEAERDALAEEKARLDSWRSELGVPDERFYENLNPFRGQPETPLEKVQRLDEKELYKISKKKKEVLEEKEKLYKRYSELQTLLTPERSESGLKRKRLRGIPAIDAKQPADPKLLATQKSIEELEAKLDAKMAQYEKYFGKLKEQELEALIESQSQGKTASSLFVVDTKDLQKKNVQELLALKMHLSEQIRAQQDIVDTLSTAFNKELALQEERAMMNTVNDGKEVNVRQLRKQIKTIEKDLRKRYHDIEDRNKHKTELLKELDETLNPKTKGTFLQTVGKPVKGTAYLAKAFIFGLPNDDETLTKAAAQPGASGKAKKLQEEIELESLMIQAQDQEISKLEKEHEILMAKASLAGGMKFRSSFVSVPYAFIEEAVQSARRVIPKKNRKAVLLNRLDNQTKELGRLKAELEATEAMIKEKTPAPEPVVTGTSGESADTAESKKEKAEPAPDEKQLRDDAMNLREQLEIAYSIYSREKGLVLGDGALKEAPKDAEGAKQYKEYKKVGGELSGLVDDELSLEGREKAILEKRIAEANKLLPTVTSKSMQQDLKTEKERISQRLSDLAVRHDFLSKEKERFSMN